MLVLLRELSVIFAGWPDAFGVLDELVDQGRGMVAQFKTNEGHTLRDAVNELSAAAAAQVIVAERMELLVGHLDSKVTLGVTAAMRIEEQQIHVADDLKQSHKRADSTTGPEGAAGDAAARSPIGEAHEHG